MTTAQSVLRDLLRRRVAPVLRAQGYAGSGQDFHRTIDGNWAAINVQRDRYSTSAEVPFTINLGTASVVVRKEDGHPPDEPAREVECHWRFRVGELLPGRTDTWWTVRASMREEEVDLLGDTTAGHLVELGSAGRREHGLGRGDPRRLPAGGAEARHGACHDGRRGSDPARARAARAVRALPGRHRCRQSGRAIALHDVRRAPAGTDGSEADGHATRSTRGQGIRAAPAGNHGSRLCRAHRGHPREAPASAGRPQPVRFAAAQSLGRLMDLSAMPHLDSMVRDDPSRLVAVHAAFALSRMDAARGSEDRERVRMAIEGRRERAVGHDRAALSELLRRLRSR